MKRMKYWPHHKLLKVKLWQVLFQVRSRSILDSPLFGDDLSRMLNSDTQQSAAFGTPAAEMGDTWSDED